MYDKSKKTWSQRLKITKAEKNAIGATASVTTNTSTSEVIAQTVANNGGNIGSQQLFQIRQFNGNAGTTTNQAMHLPNGLQYTDYQNRNFGYTSDYMSGNSSRSIKYAEPWVYSTVRGIPSRSYHHFYHQASRNYTAHPHAAAIFASPPLAATEALAVVICSCAEYLNGTKRDVKKASICKKCKGSRLPLATIGGWHNTAKLRSNGGSTPASAAATMRIVSMSKKSRPTILDPQTDPYDLMRRSRLLSPEPTKTSSTEKEKSRAMLRGKSISPQGARGRTRTRQQIMPNQKNKTNKKELDAVGTSASPRIQELQDCWLAEDDDDDDVLHCESDLAGDSSMMPSLAKNATQSRRSILRCNVNPYDLISTKIDGNQETITERSLISIASTKISSSSIKSKRIGSSQNEFLAPNNDNDVFNVEDAELHDDEDDSSFRNISTNTDSYQNKSNRINLNSTDMINKKKYQNPVRLKRPVNIKEIEKESISENGDTPINDITSISRSSNGKGNGNGNGNGSETESNKEKLNYTNVQAIAGQRISLGKRTSPKKSLIKQSGDDETCESVIIDDEDFVQDNSKPKSDERQLKTQNNNEKLQQKHVESQPKRPPRSKKLDVPDTVPISETTTSNTTTTEPTIIITEQNTLLEKSSVIIVSTAPAINIKSILKRPSKISSNNDQSVKEGCQEIEGIVSLREQLLMGSVAKTTNTTTSTTTTTTMMTTTSLAINQTTTPTSTSQFYIPLPQSRKKVQFMMEDKVIHHTIDEDDKATYAKKQPSRQQQQQQQQTNNDGDDELPMQEQLISSTNNYEYYNKKRQENKQSSPIEKSHKTSSSHGNNSSRLIDGICSTQRMEQESDFVSRGFHEIDTENCNGDLNSEMLQLLNTISSKASIVGSVEGSIKNENETSREGNLIKHYDEVNSFEKREQQQDKVTNGNNKRNNSSSNNNNNKHLQKQTQDQRIMNQQNLRSSSSSTSKHSDGKLFSLLLSATSATAATTRTTMTTTMMTTTMTTSKEGIASTSSGMLMESTILSPLQIQLDAPYYGDSHGEGQPAADAITDKIHVDGDYDDIACQKLQALVESDSNVRATQSRRPIRRSHSERMPYHNKLTSVGIENTNANVNESPKGRQDKHGNNNSNSNNNKSKNNSKGSVNKGNGILSLNFKDTTALRMKNNHKDSRNLFAQNNSTTRTTALPATSYVSTIRPKEPPPPPPTPTPTPPPTPIAIAIAQPTSASLASSTFASPTISTESDVTSSVEGITEQATACDAAQSSLHSTMATVTAALTMADGGCAYAAATSSTKENFLSLSPPAQAHSTDNDDNESRKKKQTFSPFTQTATVTTTITTTTATRAATTPSTSTQRSTAISNALPSAERENVVALMQKSHHTTSGSGLDSKKEQYREQKSPSFIVHEEMPVTKEKNQKNAIDKIISGHTAAASTIMTTTTAMAAVSISSTAASTSSSELKKRTIDGEDTKAILKGKQQQQPLHETAISAFDSRTKPKAYSNNSRSISITNNNNNNNNNQNNSGDNNNATTGKTPLLRNSAPQRTVVRVAPFNKSSSEIHRLKISHTDHLSPNELTDAYIYQQSNGIGYDGQTNINESSSCGQKKTSILINGDDCYSTMNLSHDASIPIYQSSVVVADYSSSSTNMENSSTYEGLRVTTTSNMVTISLSSPRTIEEDLIEHQNRVNRLRTRQATKHATAINGCGRAIIPIKGTSYSDVGLQRSASSTSSASSVSTSSAESTSGNVSGSGSDFTINTNTKRGRTLIKLDYDDENACPINQTTNTNEIPSIGVSETITEQCDLISHEAELLKILRNPVEAVKRNLVPHVCGRNSDNKTDMTRNRKMKECNTNLSESLSTTIKLLEESHKKTDDIEVKKEQQQQCQKSLDRNSFIAKLLEDPTLGQVADGLETETVAELIENSLKRLKESRCAIDTTGTKDNDNMNRLISSSLRRLQDERQNANSSSMNSNGITSCNTNSHTQTKEEDRQSNRGSISSANSFASANNYEAFDFEANESDCYQSCSSEITTPGEDDINTETIYSKFYQLVVDATLAEIELCTNMDDESDEHHYESIRNNHDPIYEEITDVPPPLPLTAPPINESDSDKKTSRSIFEGASKYDILSYLVDAKERGVVREESFEYPSNCSNPIIHEEDANDTLSDLGKRKLKNINTNCIDDNQRSSFLTPTSPQTPTPSLSSSSSLSFYSGMNLLARKSATSNEIERNDSGVGSETSKSSRSKYQSGISGALIPTNSPIHLCEDCDGPVETQVSEAGIMFAPLVCRKCGKKRVERKEIITEIVETEEKYGRDLQIILEEFYHPMLVAGLLTQEQLSAIFLNTEELLENNQTLAERMRDALDIAIEQGDDDLLTINIGRIFLDFTQMLHAFESYCVRQAGASLLLANLEKDKELLRIFLKVSQMENAVLRRMNLNSFLMVPVQRVTKYPLLLARLFKVTPAHLEGRDLLKQAQEKIELHLNHINQEAKDVPTKLWRRISSSSPNRRASCEIDMINIKLRKMAIDILEWNHDEVRFAMEGKLLYTQPTDGNWKKARSIKLTPVNALLVTNGKPSTNYKAEKISDKLNFPKHTGIREASLLLVKEKCGRYTLIREPLYLDRCVVCSEADWDDYFEVQEISSKDTFIFKAEDGVRTKQWYTQMQYHAQGMGAWRKRRNALANIMINGMLRT